MDVFFYLIMRESHQIICAKIKGRSMDTLLSGIDYVVYSSSNCYRIGQIVVYNTSSNTIAHRLLLKWQNCYLVAGDNCIRYEMIKKNRIVGKIDLIVKQRRVYILKQNMCNYILTGWVLIIVFINRYITPYRKEKNRNRFQLFCYRQNIKMRNRLQKHYLQQCILKGSKEI